MNAIDRHHHEEHSLQIGELVRSAQEGDRGAFDTLAAHYRPVVYTAAFVRTGHREEAEDLTQDILAQAWSKLPTLQSAAAFVPWLKVITANACRTWFRRQRPWPRSLVGDDELQVLIDPTPLPLDVLLARERERHLKAALMSLPEMNRTALMLHVWGDYSYQEIAQLTGARLTTVEGRIHRAKRQLRLRLRSDADRFFSKGAPNETTDGAVRQAPSHSKVRPGNHFQEKLMTTQPETTEAGRALALVLFTQKFAAFVEAGLSLVSCLQLLEQTPAPYGQAAGELLAEVSGGAVLSRSMTKQPALFSRFYSTFVRAGEMAGALDEVLLHMADLLTREWKLFCQNPALRDGLLLFARSDGRELPSWQELSYYQRTVAQMEFCRILGWLLASGVPFLRAMEVTGELLPAGMKEPLDEARQLVKTGESFAPPLEAAGVFAPFVIRLIAAGEAQGTLDTQLDRAASLLEHELECHLMADSVQAAGR